MIFKGNKACNPNPVHLIHNHYNKTQYKHMKNDQIPYESSILSYRSQVIRGSSIMSLK
jgi:hypothetical protein